MARVCVITGASSGIGASLARKLSELGAHCILLARREELLAELAAETGSEYEVCDVAERDQVDAAAARIAERHPAVHLLVNNAGIAGRGEFTDIGAERIEQVCRVNYLGSVWSLLAFLPLLEAGAPSDVANVVSVAGTVAGGAGGPYSAAKHAQIAFSRSTSVELAPRGIRVHTINPGFAHTEGFPQDRFLENPIARHFVLSAEDCAEAVIDAVVRNRREVFVPPFYRVPAALQGTVPATFQRVLSVWSRRTGKDGA
ncbi:MAG: SDR family oxidoreductase [Thermoleophilia bacterium]